MEVPKGHTRRRSSLSSFSVAAPGALRGVNLGLRPAEDHPPAALSRVKPPQSRSQIKSHEKMHLQFIHCEPNLTASNLQNLLPTPCSMHALFTHPLFGLIYDLPPQLLTTYTQLELQLTETINCSGSCI